VKKVEIVPLEVIIRNFSAGSFAKKMGMEEGIQLKQPTLEFSYKNDDLGVRYVLLGIYAYQENEKKLLELKNQLNEDSIEKNWLPRKRLMPSANMLLK